MESIELRERLEADLTWRQNELREIRNAHRQQGVSDASSKRVLIVMYYAHAEGFFKESLSLYVDYLNARNVLAGDARDELAAASLISEFRGITMRLGIDPGGEGGVARQIRRRHEREVVYVRKVRDACDRRLCLDNELVVDLESNLNDEVAGNVLYRLGLSAAGVWGEQESKVLRALKMLVRERNKIAHGQKADNISDRLVKEIVGKFEFACSQLVLALHDAAKQESYLRE